MNPSVTRSILPAAVFFLLSALVLPGTPHPFAAKGVQFTEAALSVDDQQQGDLGGYGGDDQEFSLTSHELTPRTLTPVATFVDIPAPMPDFPHTVSQARAPPQS